MKQIEISLLEKLLRYDASLGKMWWRRRDASLFKKGRWGKQHSADSWNTSNAGRIALNALDTKGYHHGTIFGEMHLAHRVIWALHHGEWPKGEVDHINGIRSDNRICNLRDVPKSENQRNASIRKDNKSGVVGVRWNKGCNKWVANIRHEGKQVYLGLFLTLEDAKEARLNAEKEFGYHEGHGKQNTNGAY